MLRGYWRLQHGSKHNEQRTLKLVLNIKENGVRVPALYKNNNQLNNKHHA